MDWQHYALPVAKHFWGEPARRTEREIFWGKQNARKIDVEAGTWFDFELNVGGGVADLIRHHLPKVNPAEWLRDEFGAEIDEADAAAWTLRPLPVAPRVTTYDYLRADASLHLRVTRRDLADGTKTFSQALPDGRKPSADPSYQPIPWRLNKIVAQADADLFIAEGEKACAALEQLGVLATTNPGGAKAWKPELAQYFAGRRCFVLPDKDVAGEAHAAQVMQTLAGVAAEVRLVRLPGLPAKGDAHDWIAAGGTREQLLQLCATAEVDAADITSSLPLRALSLERLMQRPPAQWLVPGILPARATAAIWGPPGSFKTFLALDLMLHIAHARTWNGRDVDGGLVVYIAGEGVAGLRARAAAWHKHHSLQIADAQFLLIEEAVPLDDGGADALIQTVDALRQGREVKAVVYDTLARCMRGDENSAEDMGAAIRAVDQVRLHLDATQLVVAHQGKDAARGLRGSSALHGALDTSLQVRKHEMHAEVLQHKQKDAEELLPMWVELQRVEFQLHCLDDLEASLVPVLAAAPGGNSTQDKLLQALQLAVVRWGRDDAPGWHGASCTLEEWRAVADELAALGGGSGESQQRAWRRGLATLERNKHVVVRGKRAGQLSGGLSGGLSGVGAG